MERSDLIPTHSVAEWILGVIDRGLDAVGLSRYATIEEAIYIAIVIAVAFVIGWIFKRLIYIAVRKIVELRKGVVARELLKWKTLSGISQVVPPLIMLGLIPFAFESTHALRTWIMRTTGVYALVAFGIALGAVITFIFNHFNEHENTRRLPMKGVLNVAKGILWIVVLICSVSILFDKSPAYLLTGLGAFAAALMLIFKDSILGFVAGIQMSQNDMLHVGDWIVVPDTPANGVVLDMTLSAVKVQNFDNTIVTVPPYTLISTSFQNYRGMSQSGARRIMKNFMIDITTVRKLSATEAADMAAQFPELKKFVDKLIASGATENNDGGLTPINGTIETNLGLFRAYISLYIYNNPGISTEQQLLIRVMDPTVTGLPLQVYCFTNTTDWDKYEAIQSAIIEHITVTAPAFGLEIYTSGALAVEVETPAKTDETDVADNKNGNTAQK